MKELYQLIWREKKDVLLALLCGLLSGLTAVALFAQSGYLISQAALLPPFYIILILTAFLKLFGVVKSATKYGERYISHRVTFRLLSDIRLRFFERLTPIASELFTRYHSGDLLARITVDVDVLQSFFLRVVYPPLVAVVTFFVTICFTVFFSPWIALILLLGYALVGFVLPLYFIQQQAQAHTMKQHVMTELTEFLYGYVDLTLHNQQKARQLELLTLAENYTQQEKHERNAMFKSQIYTQAIALFTTVAVVMIGAYAVTTHQLDGLYLAMLILIALTVFEQTLHLATIPQHYNSTKIAIKRLQEISPAQPQKSKALQPATSYVIEAHHLSFHYEAASRAALQNIHFTLQPSEKIAIVGASGCGKTTLFHLLTKTLQPTSGALQINKQCIQQIEHDSLWAAMSVQLQHNHFFSGTIRQNLLLAKPDASDCELHTVLNKAMLSKALSDLVTEKGANLSGGERQRLAFARVLLKNGAIWLLDEPFTSLDTQTEQVLMQALLTEGVDKTIILISHKLHYLKQMDRIFVMQDGHIIEHGSFTELLALKRTFYAMYQLERSQLHI